MGRELKKEIGNHFIFSLVIFILAEFFWLLSGDFSALNAVVFLIGLAVGTFILDVDHLVYWYFLKPNLEESIKARQLISQKQYQKALFLLAENHKTHISLVFHHFVFQTVLLVVSFFVISSTTSILGKGLVLAMSGHLLVDQFFDLKNSPDHLKSWLFARTPFSNLPLPHSWLKAYFCFFCLAFLLLFYFFLR
jgi:hypothetical protein